MITKVQSNYNQNYAGIKNQAGKTNSQPQFTGSYKKPIMEGLHHAKLLEKMKNLEWLKGEIGGILITALGTGLVAPIFIGFNPFVKAPKNATKEQKEENKNTKLYTAMRQPISAALAIVFQASVQKYIDKGLDAVYNNPKFASKSRLTIDQQDLNTKTFIEDTIKKEMKNENISKPSLLKSLFSSEAKEQRKAYKETLASRVKARQAEQVNRLADILEETGKIKIGERHLDFKTTAELVNEQINSYIKDAEKLTKSPERIVFHVERAKDLIENESHIREIFKDIPTMEEIKKVKDNEPELKALYQKTEETVKRLLAKEENLKVKTILQEILNKPEDLRASRIDRTLKRIDTIKEMCDTTSKEFPVNYRDALIKRNNVLSKRIVELTAAKISNPQAADETVIQKTIKKVIDTCNFANTDNVTQAVLRDTDTFDNNFKKLTKKVYKDITEGYKKLVSNQYKSWNQFTKIGVGVLVTLPITCTALNWVYPRFMEIFFPKLAGVKKANAPENKEVGGNK